MAEESVLFRVTREKTTVFHPDRGARLLPVQTGGEIELPKSVAEYHAKNGVGEIVTGAEKVEAPQDGPQETQEPRTPVRRSPGRPAAAK